MEYKNLHWESIAYIRQYLAQRLLDLDLPQQTNILRAWSTLVQWKNGHKLDEQLRQAVSLTKLPGWFNEFLSRHAIIKNETLRAVLVYPDTFYEGIRLLISLAESIGELSHIMLSEATAPLEGVWIRVVFTPTSGKPYESRQEVLQRLDPKDPKTRVVATEFYAAEDFFEMNHSRLGLQHNTRTGHQAFAAMLPLAGIQQPEKPKIEPPKVAEVEKPLDRIYRLLMNEKPHIALPAVAPTREKIEKAEDALAVIYQVLEDKAAPDAVEQIRDVLKTQTLNLEEMRQNTAQGDTQPSKAVSLLVKVYDTLPKEPVTATPPIEEAVINPAPEVEAVNPSGAMASVDAPPVTEAKAPLTDVMALVAEALPDEEQQVQESAMDSAAAREMETNGSNTHHEA